ncbi:hypothetical protein DFQ27_001940 [Actinomortierella ambigua]|uniref:Myb/SANT-like domain-containing protein n=1 Tax=Actinomortierella ambigua TaxID=1343610 RepID=A0A9P6UCP6_9FUNG|nr:hypothetical protein DFQ27_001940 [Actinomortierella ambigua]
MSKRLLDIRPRQQSIETQLVDAGANQPPEPSPVPESLASTAPKASAFWTHRGMDTFFDWITDPINHERLYKKNPVSGQKTKDLHKEIAALVNSVHNVQWTPVQVKSKIAYTRTKYREAAKLNSTYQGSDVVFKQLEICPLYTRLHEVYSGNLAANPPAPRQITRLAQESTLLVSSEEEDSSDIENVDDSDDLSVTQSIRGAIGRSSDGPASKRRKVHNGANGSDVSSVMDRIEQMTRQHMQETKADLRRRELAIEQRERELMDKLLRTAGDAWERLQKELDAARAAAEQRWTRKG